MNLGPSFCGCDSNCYIRTHQSNIINSLFALQSDSVLMVIYLWILQSSGIKVGYGRPQGAAGGRDGAISQGGGCCG